MLLAPLVAIVFGSGLKQLRFSVRGIAAAALTKMGHFIRRKRLEATGHDEMSRYYFQGINSADSSCDRKASYSSLDDAVDFFDYFFAALCARMPTLRNLIACFGPPVPEILNFFPRCLL